MGNMPNINAHNVYYWYYGTQVMRNLGGKDWEEWNRAMKKLLVESQEKDAAACAAGSWSPDRPAKDSWGQMGGRLMVTSFSCLILESYYRYPPVYQRAIQPEK